MGRKIKPTEAVQDALALLDQALALLDAAEIEVGAAHIDLAMHSLAAFHGDAQAGSRMDQQASPDESALGL